MNKKYKIGLITFGVLIAGIGLFAWFGPFNNRSYMLMLKTLLKHNVPEKSIAQAKKDKDAVFVDSREKDEYNVSHIKDAVWVGAKDFDMDRLKGVDKNKNIIVYCAVGYRSENITHKLIDAGYTSVSNLYGGIFEWINEGNKVYKDGDKVTSDIHPYGPVWGKWLRKGNKTYK